MTCLCLSLSELELVALCVVLQAVSLASPDSSYLHAIFNICVLNIAGGISSLRKHIFNLEQLTLRICTNLFSFRALNIAGATSFLCKHIS